MAWLLLKRLHFAGIRVKAIRSLDFAQLVSHRQFSEDADTKARAVAEMRVLKAVPVLLFDDLGKEKFTAHLEKELFDLVDQRSSQLLPILFTTQHDGKALAKMFTPENGEAIVRRLREFTDAIKFEPGSGRVAIHRAA